MIEEHELFTIDHSKDQTFKMVRMGFDNVQYEGGWWMEKRDHDLVWRDPQTLEYMICPRKDIGLSRDEDTRQIKIFIIP